MSSNTTCTEFCSDWRGESTLNRDVHCFASWLVIQCDGMFQIPVPLTSLAWRTVLYTIISHFSLKLLSSESFITTGKETKSESLCGWCRTTVRFLYLDTFFFCDLRQSCSSTFSFNNLLCEGLWYMTAVIARRGGGREKTILYQPGLILKQILSQIKQTSKYVI